MTEYNKDSTTKRCRADNYM